MGAVPAVSRRAARLRRVSEGFNTERTGGAGPHDPGQAAREAAERIATQVRDILGQAEERAGEIRSRAEADADVIRENAAGAAARLLERVDELEGDMERYLTDFFATIRQEVEGLSTPTEIEAARSASVSRPEEQTMEFGQSAVDEPRFEPSPQPPVEPSSVEPSSGPFPQVEPAHAPEPQPQSEPQPEAQPIEADEPRRRRGLLRRRRDEDDQGQSRQGDAEDAHVMALNMALNGTPRDETEEYLVRRFGQIDDLESILDDVYGRVKRR
jgi:cell division septation protein DedD